MTTYLRQTYQPYQWPRQQITEAQRRGAGLRIFTPVPIDQIYPQELEEIGSTASGSPIRGSITVGKRPRSVRGMYPNMVRPLEGCTSCGGTVAGVSTGMLLLGAGAALLLLFPKVWKDFLKSL